MSPYAIVFGILFVATALVAYAFNIQLSALKSKESDRQKEAEAARAASQKASKEAEAAREELTRRRAELNETKEKLSDLRAKQFKQRDAEKKQKGGAEADLNDQLSVARQDLEEERGRIDVLVREARGMDEEIVRLRDGHRKLDEVLKSAQAAAARAAAAPAPSSFAPVAAAPAAPVAAPQKTDEELKARAELLDRQLREVRRKSTEVEEELKRARGKVSTASRTQLLTKNELDLFKEKLVWSEKRVVELEKLLFDNKIVLPERPAAPQPKAPQLAPGILARETANTGGEGVVAGEAEYVPEPVAAELPTAVSAPVEAEAPATIDAGGDTAGDVLNAVPPLRRPKAVVEARKGDEGVAKAE
jgi:5-bromo-4-chloroindolyl phosphate hydrolysis protein